MRKRSRGREEADATAADGELGPARDPCGVGARVDAPGLEGRDLGQVEDVEDVDAVACDLDPAEAVDREVAERVCGGGRGPREETDSGEAADDEQLLHRASLLAVAPHRNEKFGFRRAARRNHTRASALRPRQRSIIPRWKSFSASGVPSRSARLEYGSACAHRPARSSVQASTSSPSIDGRSRCAFRASAREPRPWSASKSAVSRSVWTPFARRSRSITAIVAYCLRASAGLPDAS